MVVVVLITAAVRRGSGSTGGAEAQLLRMTYGDREQAERLIVEEQRRTPGMNRAAAAARAARRLKRDRSR